MTLIAARALCDSVSTSTTTDLPETHARLRSRAGAAVSESCDDGHAAPAFHPSIALSKSNRSHNGTRNVRPSSGSVVLARPRARCRAAGQGTGSGSLPARRHASNVARDTPVAYIDHRASHAGVAGGGEHLTARLTIDGIETLLSGSGNGPVDAFVHALREGTGADVHVLAYHEHATGTGEDATAVAYVQLRAGTRTVYGVGLDPNIVTATLKAVTAALNRGCAQGAVTLRQPLGAVAA